MEYLTALSVDELCELLTNSDLDLVRLGISENLVEDFRIDVAATIFVKVPEEERKFFFWRKGSKTITLSSYEDEDSGQYN